MINDDVISAIRDCLWGSKCRFSLWAARELFGWNNVVSELDEICTLYVYGKTIIYFVITDDVISPIRDYLGVENVVFRFWASA